MPLDNSSLPAKVILRRRLLEELCPKAVFEAFCGAGYIHQVVYSTIEQGLAVDRDISKARAFACRFPSWRAYAGDNVALLGASSLCSFDLGLIDADAWGDPWPFLMAILSQWRALLPQRVGLAVTDGLRLRLQRKQAWRTAGLGQWVQRYGEDTIHAHYLAISRDRLAQVAADWRVESFRGGYAGHAKQMTLWGAVLAR